MKVPLAGSESTSASPCAPKELAEKLTMSGTEVDGTRGHRQDWDKISVGQIVAVEPHPNADRLKLVTVDLGQGQSTVVCGAPNVRVGDKVPFAQVGAKLIDGHTGKDGQTQTSQDPRRDFRGHGLLGEGAGPLREP